MSHHERLKFLYGTHPYRVVGLRFEEVVADKFYRSVAGAKSCKDRWGKNGVLIDMYGIHEIEIWTLVTDKELPVPESREAGE